MLTDCEKLILTVSVTKQREAGLHKTERDRHAFTDLCFPTLDIIMTTVLSTFHPDGKSE